MDAQGFIADGIDSDSVEADAPELHLPDQLDGARRKAGVFAEVFRLAPKAIPARVEEQEVAFPCRVAQAFDALRPDQPAFGNILAIDDDCASGEEIDWEAVKGPSVFEDVRRRVHMRSRVAEHGEERFLETIAFDGACIGKAGRLRPRVDGHVFGDGMGEVDDCHRGLLYCDPCDSIEKPAPSGFALGTIGYPRVCSLRLLAVKGKFHNCTVYGTHAHARGSG